jgi:hypothetical protein
LGRVVQCREGRYACRQDGIRFDALFFRIELEFASSQIRHTPKVPATAAPIQTAEVQTTTGDAVVESQIPLPQ